MRLPVAAVNALALLTVAAPARADENPGVQGSFESDGNPTVYGWIEYGTPGEAEVRRCASDPAAPCERLPPTASDADRPNHRVPAGPTAPGTVFEVAWVKDGVTQAVKHTPAWTGQLRAVTPPAIEGAPVVGRRVRIRPAAWTGGWDEPLWAGHSYSTL